MQIRRVLVGSLSVAWLLGCLAGCGESTVVDYSGDPRPQGPGKALATKADQWNAANSPERFRTDLNYKLAELPTAGRSEHIPWPATYWPTYEDGINVRWNGQQTLSPMEKYDVAFNGWVATEEFRKLKPYNGYTCLGQDWDDAYYEQLGPAAKYTSMNKGAWKAHDGKDSDGDGETDECDDNDGVESWWGLCHAWVPAAILEEEPQHAVTYNGVTFEVSDIKGLLISQYDRTAAYMIGGRCNDKEVKRDETGRITDPECRDTNAGSWHVVMANFLGVMHRAIAEDRTYDYEVWNQPIIEWKVNALKAVTGREAMEALGLGADVEKYPYNEKAVSWSLVDASSFYITESDTSTEAFTDVISTYTREDRYHYVLELDADGLIIGGEWIGDDNSRHPDFLWLPTAPTGGNPNVDLATVRMLLERSRAAESDEPAPEVKVYENSFAFDIPDNDADGVGSTIAVPDAGKVSEIMVTVDIEHPFVGDLKVSLRKDGVESMLHANAGGSAHNLKRSFFVTDLVGAEAAGNWELRVVDNAASDAGRIVSWKLSLGLSDEPPAVGGSFVVTSSEALEIPNHDEQGVVSTLTVSERQTLKALKVTVDVDHSYIGSLVVTLKHGALTETLHNHEGGSGTAISKTFDVTTFNGSLSDGEWTLTVVDADEQADTGTLKSWSLECVY